MREREKGEKDEKGEKEGKPKEMNQKTKGAEKLDKGDYQGLVKQ